MNKSCGDKPNWQAIYYISAPTPIKKNVRKGIYAERRKNPETYHGTEWKDRTHSAAFNGYAMNELCLQRFLSQNADLMTQDENRGFSNSQSEACKINLSPALSNFPKVIIVELEIR